MSQNLRSLRIFTVSLCGFAILMAAIPNAFVQNSLAQTCSPNICYQQNCDGLPGLPPQNPPARSFDDFIVQAYLGAYGRYPTCFERQNEYSNLVNAAANGAGALLAEARRFVATRFMTQASYSIPGIDMADYEQTGEYEQRNTKMDLCWSRQFDFIADLYRAFLQREPDQAGQCFWTNNVCAEGRKKGIRAFEVSIEFGNLVNGLSDGGQPCCAVFCRFGTVFNPDTCSCEPVEPCPPGMICGPINQLTKPAPKKVTHNQ